MSDQDTRNLGAILKAAQLIRSFVKGIDARIFANDVMRQRAVNGQIWLMAAAAKRISESFKNDHPMIPWECISWIGESVLRSREDDDPDAVFQFAKKSIPQLILMLSGLVPKDEEAAG